MNAIIEDTALLEKTKELCAAIVEDPQFLVLQGKIELFLENDEARLHYQNVSQRGEELHQKQNAGIELSQTEIESFQQAKKSLFENSIASDFIEAQQSLQSLQSMISKYIGMTMELGRVPTEEDFASASGGGCCGGSGGGGCGC